MNPLPDTFRTAWKRVQNPLVFSTTDTTGTPNAIFVTCIRKYDDETILIADNYFNKTRENIRRGGKGTVLFITDEKKSFQVKGTVTYHTNGVYRDFMVDCLDEKYPVVGVVKLAIEKIYSGAEQLM